MIVEVSLLAELACGSGRFSPRTPSPSNWTPEPRTGWTSAVVASTSRTGSLQLAAAVAAAAAAAAAMALAVAKKRWSTGRRVAGAGAAGVRAWRRRAARTGVG